MKDRPSLVRLKLFLLNSALILVSVLGAYLVLEFAFFRFFLPTMPLRLRPQLPAAADVLTQNSKAAFVPRDYVALLGDSYAEGIGDWLWQTEGNRTKPFHSANVIHELTGRDVVSFGKGGAGSAEGIVERPAKAFLASSCYLFPLIDPPRQIFIYYYEGNDVEDNLNFENKVLGRYGRVDAGSIDRYLTEQYAVRHFWDCHLELADMASRMTKFLYEYYVSGLDLFTCSAITGPSDFNRLIVAGRTVSAPTLQGPALGVSDEYIQSAMLVLDRSLTWLQHRFENVPITMVYVPSPLSLYHFAGEDVSNCAVPIRRSSVASVERNSDFISALVQKSAAQHGIDFIDVRPALRALAATTVIHGPKDWDHFNEAGYRALGAIIAAHVTARP
jgi:hypothetical protein